jgi:2-polyprenyl-3-methyl-5-hydroxy-6-metoxy-1,4-benzoquinol methylase
LTTHKRQVTELRSFEDALASLAISEAYAGTLIARFRRIVPLEPGAGILDVGAAQGGLVIGLTKQGFRAVGLEPWDKAREMARRLAQHAGVTIEMVEGVGERIPLESGQFAAVLACYVMEHVHDAQATINEAYRVLRPGGVFWFSSVSSLCPRQSEISGFPVFGWYPDRLKRRILEWAKTKRPHLVGHTQTPAINWWTPRKARRMLRAAGFQQVYDRWDLRLPSESGRLSGAVLKIIRSCGLTKFVADVMFQNCAYAAVK